MKRSLVIVLSILGAVLNAAISVLASAATLLMVWAGIALLLLLFVPTHTPA